MSRTAPTDTMDVFAYAAPRCTRVLLYGATSCVGRPLVASLDAAGVPVTALTRAATVPPEQPLLRWLQGSLPHAPALTGDITHIICLGPGDLFVDWLACQGSQPALRQIIALGSTSADSKIDSAAAPERELAARLRATEAQLAAHAKRIGVVWTLLRPTLIYGGGADTVARVGRWIRRRHLYPWLLGAAARARRQPVHAHDLAQAVQACIDREAAFDRVFNLPGGEVVSLRDLIRRIGRASGTAVPLPVPLGPALRALLYLKLIPDSAALSLDSQSRWLRDQVYDLSPAAAALGYAPRRFTPDAAEW